VHSLEIISTQKVVVSILQRNHILVPLAMNLENAFTPAHRPVRILVFDPADRVKRFVVKLELGLFSETLAVEFGPLKGSLESAGEG
jgi:hypothetical protein